ncbi:hypothetical protein BGY98DRAFT_929936 [Russula aff. rugulosa BPL654]|nr:hypothetical protein BGY98DRAFT_929936 [Russula aff. rugulosa BPL654]
MDLIFLLPLCLVASSLILASLVVSLSSLSALAAPVGDGPEDSSSYARTANSSKQYLQTSNLVDKVTAPLPVLPELGKAIPDILHAILDPLVGEDIPKAQGKTLDLVKTSCLL